MLRLKGWVLLPVRLTAAEWRRQPFAVALGELADTSPTSFGYLNTIADNTAPKLGRPRLAGDWPALYLAYVLGGCPALRAWYNRAASSPLWAICDFESRPSYQAVHQRFAELEKQWRAVVAVAHDLIDLARSAEPAGSPRPSSSTPAATKPPVPVPAAIRRKSSVASRRRKSSPTTGPRAKRIRTRRLASVTRPAARS